MITLQGNYGEAIIFTDTLETSAAEQIRAFCDQPGSLTLFNEPLSYTLP